MGASSILTLVLTSPDIQVPMLIERRLFCLLQAPALTKRVRCLGGAPQVRSPLFKWHAHDALPCLLQVLDLSSAAMTRMRCPTGPPWLHS